MTTSTAFDYWQVRAVLGWCRFYTAGLPQAVADERRDELASDVWEQMMVGSYSKSAARSVIWRAFKGVSGDLRWRRIASRTSSASVEDNYVFLVIFVGVAALSLAGLGVFREERQLHLFVAIAQPDFQLVVTAMLAAACGMAMLLRRRTRPLGAIWVGTASITIVVRGTSLLAANAAVLGQASRDAVWIAAIYSLAAGLLILFSAATVALWQPRRPSK